MTSTQQVDWFEHPTVIPKEEHTPTQSLSKPKSKVVEFSAPSCGPPLPKFWHDVSNPDVDVTDRFYVTHVDSPNRLWVQNLKQKEDFALLTAEMTDWYNKFYTTSNIILPHNMVEGGYYAAYLDDKEQWVRIRVLETIIGRRKRMEYIVHLLDYGIERRLPLENFFYLRPNYNILPMQATPMEIYYEDGPRDFTFEDKLEFDEDICGKEVDVIPVSARDDLDVGFSILQGILMTRQIKSVNNQFSVSDFYTLNGKLCVIQLIQDIKDFQGQRQGHLI